MNLIILAAGKPTRGVSPSVLQPITENFSLLDWMLRVFDSHANSFSLVGGYHFKEIISKYPALRYTLNPQWSTTGSLKSFLMAPVDIKHPVSVCYGDVVFSKKIVDTFFQKSDSDVVIAVDKKWRVRYEGRLEDDFLDAEKVNLLKGKIISIGRDLTINDETCEFAGLIKFSPTALQMIETIKKDEHFKDNASIIDLIECCRKKGLRIDEVDVSSEWAELDAPQDLAKFILKTKAIALDRLQFVLKKGKIANLLSFSFLEWNENSENIIEQISVQFFGYNTIVRSSSLKEDSWHSSQAGAYDSVLNVPASDGVKIREAIEKVFNSYGEGHDDNQIIIQEMISNVRASGVVLTRTLTTGAPYYTINYELGDDTTAVTSGAKVCESSIIHKTRLHLLGEQNPIFENLLPGVVELEDLLGYDSLDIEFAISDNNQLWILQVRPIAVDYSAWKIDDKLVGKHIELASSHFESLQTPSGFLFGDKAIFGNMPDWNPAEIIGTRPRQLAFSLYRHLITDNIWAEQRSEFGYRDVRPCRLLHSFAGRPYIDVRASFNSFIPQSLSDQLANKLVNFYLSELEEKPHLHDKVEFEIALTCYTFDFDERAIRLKNAGFSNSEILELKKALIELTEKAFYRSEKDLAQIEKLTDRYNFILENSKTEISSAYLLLEDVKKYGTLPFAHLAREAFVAMSLLKSMIKDNIITEEDVSSFLESLRTVATRIQEDGNKVANGDLDWKQFVEIYGHLRPGTYEITSSSYQEDPELYLRQLIQPHKEKEIISNLFDRKDVSSYLKIQFEKCGWKISIEEFKKFLVDAIEGREYSKFIFTKNISKALDFFVEFAKKNNISRDEISHVSVLDLLQIQLGTTCSDIEAFLRARIEEASEFESIVHAVELPHLIISKNDFWFYEHPLSMPNFVTQKKIVSDTVSFSTQNENGKNLANKIILIGQADPGYDWLFGHNIAGLITMYGGANSHMAIRCAEFGIPAAIGVGEKMYNQLSNAKVIQLDCSGKSIKAL